MEKEYEIEWYFSLAECLVMIASCIFLQYFIPLLMLNWVLYGIEKHLMKKYHRDISIEELAEKLEKL